MVKTFGYKSKIGKLLIGVEDDFLISIYFTTQDEALGQPFNSSRINKKIIQQLKNYFSGNRKQFNLPIKLNGTKFQNQVWKELLKIPYGQTRSYGDIAKRIKNPRAVRAVGSAIGKNPIGIVIPCHRVIKSSGELGKYAWGSDIKKKLLELENNQL